MRKKIFLPLFISTLAVACLVTVLLGLLFYIRFGISSGIIAILCAVFICCAYGALATSRKTVDRIVRPIESADPAFSDISSEYPELAPFTDYIAQQNDQIQKQLGALQIDYQEGESMRKEFTANVSHELKTPLTSISGFAEIIRDGIVKEEDISRFAGKIYDEAQRLVVLVEDIMRLSQLDENQIPAELSSVDIYAKCTDVIGRLKPSAEKRGVTFSLTGDHAEVIGSDSLISEMIYNLCDNAIKYNVENGHVTVSVSKGKNSVDISVSDTGIGIPADDLDRVFERFYRVNKSHSKEIGGTGLGLSIVKHGAAFHNAKVELTSTVDVGTTVTLSFPI